MTEGEGSGLEKLFDGVVDIAIKYKLIQKLIAVLTRTRHVVLLCGTSGVGKTQFVQSLNDPLASPVDPDNRTRSWGKVKYSADTIRYEFLDTPGQVEDEPLRQRAYLAALKEKRFGIINVVANGYHEGVAPESMAIDRLPDGTYTAKASFLEANRRLEIESAQEWRIMLMDAKWLLTLVNKADLWWTPETWQGILRFYKEGQYATKLEAWQGKHVVLPYSAVFRPFYDRAAMTGFLSEDKRLTMQASLLETVARLIEGR